MKPTVVICGSFHRDPVGLKRLFRELEATGCRILSPLSTDYDTSVTVARDPHEQDFSVFELEKYHLRAIREADFIMLHAPEGYTGLSTAYEIGYATALKKPVFTKSNLNDEMLSSQVNLVDSVFEAQEAISF